MAQQAPSPHPSLFGGPWNSNSNFSAPDHHQQPTQPTQGPAAMSSALSTTAGNNIHHPDAHSAAALHAASASSSVAGAGAGISTPASNASSANNTYIMPNSPVKNRNMVDGYRPKVTRTLGQRP